MNEVIRLSEAAFVNPRGPKPGEISADELCDFVPMASVREDGTMAVEEQRPYGQVSKGYTSFRSGDVLLAKITPCFENGKIALATTSTEYAFGSTEFHVIRSRKEKLESRYLLYFLRQMRIRVDGESKMTGSAGQKRVPRIFLDELVIPLPSRDEQRRIAAILDKADAIRRKREQVLSLANDFLRSVFLEMFGDPIKNPKKWPLRRLGDLGVLDRGKSRHRPRNDPRLLGGPYPLVQTGDVARADRILEEYSSTYSEYGLAQSRLWPKGTLCITIAANIADTAILGMDACFPDSVVGFTPSDEVVIHYVQAWFGFLRDVISDKAPQSAQKNINLRILRDLEVPVPPIRIQLEHSKIVDLIYQSRKQQKDQLLDACELFAALSQRAFRSEL
jgi:type I restriction enzyme S subunit